MNLVDLAVLGVVAISAILAFMRGFVREVLGIAAWAGAAYLAVALNDMARPYFRQWIGSPDIADPVSYLAVFVVGLIIFSIITNMIGKAVHSIGLGGVDRSLGVLFGIVRGAALVIAVYIVGGLLTAPDHWPDQVRTARLLPFAHDGAVWVVDKIPSEHRPKVAALPAGRDPTSETLLQSTPQGRATGKPATSP